MAKFPQKVLLFSRLFFLFLQSSRGSGTQSSGGSGTQNAGGSGTQNAGGSGTQNAGGSGTQNAGGSGTQNAGGSGTQNAGGSGTQNAGGSGTQNAGGSGTHSSAPSNLQFVILEGSEFCLDKINSVEQKPYGSVRTIQTLRSYYDEGYELVGMAAKKFGHLPVFVYIMVKGTVRQQQQALLIENVQKIDALGKKNDMLAQKIDALGKKNDLLAQKIDALFQNIDIVLPMKNASKKSDQKNDFSPPMNSLDKKKRDIRDGKKKESDE